MKKKNLNITIDPDAIPTKPVEPIPYKKISVPDELQPVEKLGKKKEVNLNFADGLRLAERLLNKWLGSLIGNNENPLPKLPGGHLVYLLVIIILIILLWVTNV